jgi:hypothetical protein
MGRGKSSGGGVRSKRLNGATGITGVAASLPEGFVKVECVCAVRTRLQRLQSGSVSLFGQMMPALHPSQRQPCRHSHLLRSHDTP